MARKIYPRTDETFKVLSDFESRIAREMECDPSYINKVKNGVEQDRFPQFREIFRAACNAHAPVEFWLNDLMAIYTRSRKADVCVSQLSGKLLEKIETDADAAATLVKSLRDNHLTEAECHEILAKMTAKEATTAAIKEIVLNRLAAIKEEKK